VQKLEHMKPDGRRVVLYASQTTPSAIAVETLGAAGPPPEPHLRWHPLRGEWIVYAGHRQERTFLPPPEYDPLAPTRATGPATEIPDGEWDVAVFENRFPSLTEHAGPAPRAIVPTGPARGVCEVVVYTREAGGALGLLPLWHLELLFEVWADRTREVGAREDVRLVFPFENRGVEVGATLHHPHGQIYAYPFIPPVIARELATQRAHFAAHGHGLLDDLIAAELTETRRVLYAGERAVAFVPAWARYTYEVWIAPRRPVATLDRLAADDRADLARALKTVLLQYDGLWSRPMPYVMVFHQAPSDGEDHPEAHLHIELYPPYRSADRLKYLAGSELGAGVFTNDTLPEAKAGELRAVDVALE
jgi:UDPglucose--hexose-1-phosphate uridylyltransferase